MTETFLASVRATLDSIRAEGLWKAERSMTGAQGAHVVIDGKPMLNLCANNYLGLADDPRLVTAAKDAMDEGGYGMASVRFICGTAGMHRELEGRLAGWLAQEDAILFAACFDANGGLFEPLLGPEDAVISDALNHASIIDGIRLCKAKRYRYANSDMQALEEALQTARDEGARHVMVATDGVFSMDGYLAKLPEIRALCDRYDAMLMVDDCHAAGFMGPKGAGTPAHFGVQVDVVTGTLGKALGGALGGYIAGPQPVIDLLRQRARPYLFSNALPPAVVGAGLAALDIVQAADDLREQLFRNAAHWRTGLTQAGFRLLPGEHAIVPVMTGDAQGAQALARSLADKGVHVAPFFFPVVPKGQARIRTQMNARLTAEDIDFAIDAFTQAGRETGVLQ